MSPKIKILKTIKLEGITPYSTNSLWFAKAEGYFVQHGRYIKWKRKLNKILPSEFLPNDMTGFGLYIEVGIFREFDIDNTLKSLIDALQKKYQFNDNQIDYIYAKKVIVRKFDISGAGDRSKDYIKVSLIEKVSFEESTDHKEIKLEKSELSELQELQELVQKDRWSFHLSGRNISEELKERLKKMED